MVKKVVAFFYTDILWKLLALGLSVILWLVSMTMFDPEENKFHPTTLLLDNIAVLEAENVVLLNDYELLTRDIMVGVRAAASQLTPTQMQEIRPSIDFRAVLGWEVHAAEGLTEIALPVSVHLPLGLTLLHTTPFEVIVRLDALIRSSFPVEIIQIGTVGTGAQLESLSVANTSVTLTGPRSVVNQVGRVQVFADVQGLTENVSSSVPITVYDIYGYDITEALTLNVSETVLRKEILHVKRVPFRPVIAGTLAEGFAVAEYEITPTEIYLAGTAERMADIEAIVPIFDLEQASEDFSRVFNINDEGWLPVGTALAQGQLSGVYFNVTVEPINERTINILRRNIGVFGGNALYTVQNNPTHVTVRVSGPASRIAQLMPTDITVNLNLHNREIGIHRIPLQVILPSGFHLEGPVPFLEVRIYEPAEHTAENNGINQNTQPPVDPNPPTDPDPSDDPDPDPDPTENGEYPNGEEPPEED
ncbi:MAG: CdaR family protein [Defluviitaleaceae bacterium]|nr:CdaR family protein [Defluviitaleaceae bacterium]